MKTLALNMIVKNEEDNLQKFKFIDNFKLFDEVVIVDTGSTDNTKQILKKIDNVKLIELSDWNFDFSLARNIGLKNTNSDFILHLDADYKINPDDIIKLKDEIQHLKDNAVLSFVLRIIYKNGEDERVRKILLHPNRSDILFENPIHETITKSLYRNNYKVIKSNIIIDDYSYFDEGVKRKKLLRNLNIMKKFQDKINNPYIFYSMGITMLELSEIKEAQNTLLDLISKINKNYFNTIFSYLHMVYYYLSYIELLYNKNIENSLRYIDKSLEIEDKNPILFNFKGLILLKANRFKDAKEEFEKSLNLIENNLVKFEVPINIKLEQIKSLEGIIRSLFFLNDYKNGYLYMKKLLELDKNPPSYLFPIFAKLSIENNDIPLTKYFLSKIKNG